MSTPWRWSSSGARRQAENPARALHPKSAGLRRPQGIPSTCLEPRHEINAHFGLPVGPLSFVSLVLFALDAPSNSFRGSFEFKTVDLTSRLFGTVAGIYADPDAFSCGGQFSVEYKIRGGRGMFAGFSGFGLSLIEFDRASTFNNYSEAGLLSFTAPVPEPSIWRLMSLGLGLLA